MAAAAFCFSAATPCLLAADHAATASAGVISGTVTNKTTGNGLLGAKVEIPQLGVSALVDNTGRYVLNVPPGSYELVVTYIGMDTQRTPVSVAVGQPAVQDFVMSSAVLVLDAFKVAAEKEGMSAAITQQRNADNLKTVASMDALSDLPNMNATELAIRLPGVTFGDPGDEVVEQISVRGMGTGTTSITIDGGGMASFSAQGRTTRMTAFTGNMFESLELTKGQTPDRPVDSLGGSVNFKTRSPLSMREKRRLWWNAQYRTAPSFTEQVPIREEHRNHGLFNIQYTEKFAILGAERENFAVSVNGFYSENAFGFYQTNRDYQQTNNQPAYLWDYRTRDNFNVRKQRSISSKFDFRLTRNDLFKLNVLLYNAPEPMRRQYNTRAFAGSQTTSPTSATSAIVAGTYTDRVTVVRALPTAANATSGTTAPALIEQGTTNINRDQRGRHIDFGGEHTWGPFEVDWNALWSRVRYRTLGNEVGLTNRIGNVPYVGPNGRLNTVAGTPSDPLDNIVGPNGETGVGWILDRTQNDLYPKFIQNGGLDFTNPNNWRPSVNGLSTSAGNLDVDLIRELRGNVKYRLPFLERFPTFFKTGYAIRDHNVELYRENRRWSYIGRNALPTTNRLTWDQVKTGRAIPYWEGAQFYNHGRIVDPTLWKEDLYEYYRNKLASTVRTHEIITGYYAMLNGKIGRLGYLGGVRHEITETIGYLNVRSRTLTTTAQQTADPQGSALLDYGNPTRNAGRYAQNFPSLHTWYDLTANLKLRAAWSTGMARPNLNNAVTALSIDTNGQTVTFGNPALKPKRSKNWDFAAEYSFSNASYVKVGWFHKRIDDYIRSNQPIGVVGIGENNGFNGNYEGYEILANSNAGSAFTQGWEFEYFQQFRFLPGLLRTLRFSGNFTKLMAHGDYGTPGVYLTTAQIDGFIPFTANASLSWDYQKFGVSVSYNYTDESIRGGYNIANPSRNRYMMPRDLFNLNLRYQLPRNMTVNFGVQNLFNEPQRYYRGIHDQLETFLIQGTALTASIEGRF